MNVFDLAEMLAGATYPCRIDRDVEARAKDAGIVIVFGASDDLMEFRGAIHDELGAYDGTTAFLTRAGLLTNDCENDECPHFAALKRNAATVDALWCAEPGYSWTYRTDIPHATFDISEDGEPYCRGIVFALSEVRGPTNDQH